MGVSRRGFAKLAGVSEMAVRKAIKAGRITLSADGKIDPGSALEQWERGTDPARTHVRTDKRPTKSAAVRTEQDAADAITLIRRILAEEGADSSGEIDFGMARIAETNLKARERELKVVSAVRSCAARPGPRARFQGIHWLPAGRPATAEPTRCGDRGRTRM